MFRFSTGISRRSKRKKIKVCLYWKHCPLARLQRATQGRMGILLNAVGKTEGEGHTEQKTFLGK